MISTPVSDDLLQEFMLAHQRTEIRALLEVEVEFAEKTLANAANPVRPRPVSRQWLKVCQRRVVKAKTALAAFILSQP
jgi:hypothetical protein